MDEEERKKLIEETANMPIEQIREYLEERGIDPNPPEDLQRLIDEMKDQPEP